MSDETTLLPCPFCGGEAFVNDDPTGNGGQPHMSGNVGLGRLWSVECDECGADGGFWQEREVAIEAWNTRTERTCHIVKETKTLRSFAHGEVEVTDERCSECNGFMDVCCGVIRNYCPKCGAKVVDE